MRTLREGGRFVFSTLGPATFRELRESVNKAALLAGKNGLPPFMEFTGSGKLANLLAKAGFVGIRIENKNVVRYYKDAYELLRTLKRIGAKNPNAEGEKTSGEARFLRRPSTNTKNPIRTGRHNRHLRGIIRLMQETMNSYDDQHYLFVRPVSENAVSAESFVEKLPPYPALTRPT